MANKLAQQMQFHGSTAPGFEAVANLFERNMKTLAEEHAQLCVYVGEEKVVDLWASASDDSGFNADSLVNIFSSGKSLEAIVLATLVAQGLLDYNARIVEYWPEFGANGKEALTVADLMRHEAGLVAFDVSLDPTDLHRENIKRNHVGRIIEAQAQKYPQGEGKRREYHAVTRGWIVNELFRRVDPQQRTIGEFLQDAISGPLNGDAFIGVQAQEMARVVQISPIGFGFHFRQSCRPRALGRQVQHNVFELSGRLLRMLPNLRRSSSVGAPSPIKGMAIDSFNDPVIAMGETPSANTHASARGLAQIAAMMANGGRWGDKQVLTSDAWAAMHDAPVQADMGFRTTFTQGGVAQFSRNPVQRTKLERALNNGREGFYGWMGLGGSVFQWHPEKKIGFSFVPTSLHVMDLVNERAKAYQTEVLNCLQSS